MPSGNLTPWLALPGDAGASPLPDDAIETLGELLSAVSIVHHVPGRVRLRLAAGLEGALTRLDLPALLTWFQARAGILSVRINTAAASLVVSYDAALIEPQWWERTLGSAAYDIDVSRRP